LFSVYIGMKKIAKCRGVNPYNYKKEKQEIDKLLEAITGHRKYDISVAKEVASNGKTENLRAILNRLNGASTSSESKPRGTPPPKKVSKLHPDYEHPGWSAANRRKIPTAYGKKPRTLSDD